jgi:hypothetical protein
MDLFWRVIMRCSAGGRNRTDMPLRALDFESSAYTNFATPARIMNNTNT